MPDHEYLHTAPRMHWIDTLLQLFQLLPKRGPVYREQRRLLHEQYLRWQRLLRCRERVPRLQLVHHRFL